MLPRAVVLEPRGLRAALEVVLGRTCLREQSPYRLELIRPVQVRRAGDRDLGIVEIRTYADDRKSLDRLRRAPEVREERRIAAGVDDFSVGDGDGVDPMAAFHDVTSPGVDDERVHVASQSAVQPS